MGKEQNKHTRTFRQRFLSTGNRKRVGGREEGGALAETPSHSVFISSLLLDRIAATPNYQKGTLCSMIFFFTFSCDLWGNYG